MSGVEICSRSETVFDLLSLGEIRFDVLAAEIDIGVFSIAEAILDRTYMQLVLQLGDTLAGSIRCD